MESYKQTTPYWTARRLGNDVVYLVCRGIWKGRDERIIFHCLDLDETGLVVTHGNDRWAKSSYQLMVKTNPEDVKDTWSMIRMLRELNDR